MWRKRIRWFLGVCLIALGCSPDKPEHVPRPAETIAPGTVATFAGETVFNQISPTDPYAPRYVTPRDLSYVHQEPGAVGRRLCYELKSGDFVDLNFVFPTGRPNHDPSAQQGYVSIKVIQSVPVIGTQENDQMCEIEFRTTPEQFINLTAFTSRGRANILLREPTNRNVHRVRRSTLITSIEQLSLESPKDADLYGVPISSFDVSERDLHKEKLNLVARYPDGGQIKIANDVKVSKFHRQADLFGLESTIAWMPEHLATATLLFQTTNARLEFTTDDYDEFAVSEGEVTRKPAWPPVKEKGLRKLAQVDENGTLHVDKDDPLYGEVRLGDRLRIRKVTDGELSAPIALNVVSTENGIEPAEVLAEGDQLIVSFVGDEQEQPKNFGLADALKDLETIAEERRRFLNAKVQPKLRGYWFDVKTALVRSGNVVDVVGRYRTGWKTEHPGFVAINILQNVDVTDQRTIDDRHQIKLALTEEEYLLMRLSERRASFDYARQLQPSKTVQPIYRSTLVQALRDLELIHVHRMKRRRKMRGDRPPSTFSMPSGSVGLTSPLPTFSRPQSASLQATSTFSIDVDTTSFSLTKEALQRGEIPQVRTEEFVNAFEYNYPEPQEGEDFALLIDGSNSPLTDSANTKLIRIAIQAPRVVERSPVQLIFVIDTSGSMYGETRMVLLKQTLREITERMIPGDTIGIVTFGDTAEVRLRPTGTDQKERILAEIDRLRTHGSTALEDGVRQAYDLAAKHQQTGVQSRVIIASDGDGNLGDTDGAAFTKTIRHHRDNEIFLTILGFGATNLRDTRLERISNNGNGNYHYIGDGNDIDRLISKTLFGNLHAVAKDMKVQVFFDANKVKTHRLIGYENRSLNEEDFANDSVDAGELGSGLAVTALYDVELLNGASGELGTVDVRYKRVGESKSRHQSFGIDSERFHNNYAQTPESFRLATGVAAFAEIMKQPGLARTIDLAAVLDSLTEIQTTDQERDLTQMIKRFASLQK